MATTQASGHRERLRSRFIAGGTDSLTEEALLELLLTYAIPQKDVKPLAKQLLSLFGNLESVLSASITELCKVDGIKENSAVLLKLIPAINSTQSLLSSNPKKIIQMPLLVNSDPSPEYAAPNTTVQKQIRLKTGLFSKANLKEAIEILPRLPDTESIFEVRQFLINNLHFSAQQTRHRYANYIISRMFPAGMADKALRAIAYKYSGMKELRETCFYRFCKAEPLMLDVISELLIPAIGIGKISRQRITNYLVGRFPESKSIGDCSQAIVEALNAGGVARADRTHISFSYREISPVSLAFIIHSEFTEPGMYDLTKLEENRYIKAMLWNPTNLVQMLYELRNLGLISKISEIDNVRQFTTKWELSELVDRITS
mgnify:CR=1 FL=1